MYGRIQVAVPVDFKVARSYHLLSRPCKFLPNPHLGPLILDRGIRSCPFSSQVSILSFAPDRDLDRSFYPLLRSQSFFILDPDLKIQFVPIFLRLLPGYVDHGQARKSQEVAKSCYHLHRQGHISRIFCFLLDQVQTEFGPVDCRIGDEGKIFDSIEFHWIE